jgi:hypothetical protein
MLDRYRELGDTNTVRKLEAAPVTMEGGMPPSYVAVRDEAMHRLGIGTMHTMTNYLRGLFLGSLQTREYTLSEKLRLWRGKFSAGVSLLLDEVTTTDLCEILAGPGPTGVFLPRQLRLHRQLRTGEAVRTTNSAPR